MSAKSVKLAEIAARISAHLKRFEANPEINKADPRSKIRPYYCAFAYSGGARVFIRYVNFQNKWSLARDEATAYLAWLDAGNVGTHYQQQDQVRVADARQDGRDL